MLKGGGRKGSQCVLRAERGSAGVPNQFGCVSAGRSLKKWSGLGEGTQGGFFAWAGTSAMTKGNWRTERKGGVHSD